MLEKCRAIGELTFMNCAGCVLRVKEIKLISSGMKAGGDNSPPKFRAVSLFRYDDFQPLQKSPQTPTFPLQIQTSNSLSLLSSIIIFLCEAFENNTYLFKIIRHSSSVFDSYAMKLYCCCLSCCHTLFPSISVFHSLPHNIKIPTEQLYRYSLYKHNHNYLELEIPEAKLMLSNSQ